MVSLKIEVAGGGVGPFPARIIATQVAVTTATDEGKEPLTKQVRIPGIVGLQLAASSGFMVTVEADGYWSPKLVVAPQKADETRFLTVRPLATLSGKTELVTFSQEVASGRTDAKGRWQHGDLEPGSYQLIISDSRRSRVAFEEIDVQPDQTDFQFDLPLVWVRGEVRLSA